MYNVGDMVVCRYVKGRETELSAIVWSNAKTRNKTGRFEVVGKLNEPVDGSRYKYILKSTFAGIAGAEMKPSEYNRDRAFKIDYWLEKGARFAAADDRDILRKLCKHCL